MNALKLANENCLNNNHYYVDVIIPNDTKFLKLCEQLQNVEEILLNRKEVRFGNGSKMNFYTEEDCDLARGGRINLGIIYDANNIFDIDYIVNTILDPKTQTDSDAKVIAVY